ELANAHHVIHDAARDVNTCRLDAIAKLHRVVDLADEQAVRVFEQIDRQDAATNRPGCRPRQPVNLRRHRAIARLTAASRVRDPVWRFTIDGADRLVADHEAANVAGRLAHELLHV